MTTYIKPSKLIAQELKAIGITNKQVSVTMRHGSVDCYIKDITIDPETVSAIAKKHEQYETCQYSGEILAGGNTFVFVQYAFETEKQACETEEYKTFFAEIESLFNSINDNTLESVRGSKVLIGKTWAGNVSIWNLSDRYCSNMHNIHTATWTLFTALKNGSLFKAKEA